MASAWLIRRFIDPSEFRWLEKTQGCPEDRARFDFDGAEFTHMAAGDVRIFFAGPSFGLDSDRAIARLGALVHYLDVGGIPVAQKQPASAAIMAGHVRSKLRRQALHSMVRARCAVREL